MVVSWQSYMQWTDCSDAFHRDGSLRDLYVHDTTIGDWDAFVAFLTSSSYRIDYYKDGTQEPVPNSAATVFSDREHTHNLCIHVRDLKVHCHFFTTEEIELDLDPREVRSQAQLDAVLDFISNLGTALRRDVMLTEENGPEHVWFKFAAAVAQLTYIEAS